MRRLHSKSQSRLRISARLTWNSSSLIRLACRSSSRSISCSAGLGCLALGPLDGEVKTAIWLRIRGPMRFASSLRNWVTVVRSPGRDQLDGAEAGACGVVAAGQHSVGEVLKFETTHPFGEKETSLVGHHQGTWSGLFSPVAVDVHHPAGRVQDRVPGSRAC